MFCISGKSPENKKILLFSPSTEGVLFHVVRHVAPPYFDSSPNLRIQTLTLKWVFTVFGEFYINNSSSLLDATEPNMMVLWWIINFFHWCLFFLQNLYSIDNQTLVLKRAFCHRRFSSCFVNEDEQRDILWAAVCNFTSKCHQILHTLMFLMLSNLTKLIKKKKKEQTFSLHSNSSHCHSNHDKFVGLYFMCNPAGILFNNHKLN